MNKIFLLILAIICTACVKRDDDIVSVPAKYCTQTYTGRNIIYDTLQCQPTPTFNADGTMTINPCGYTIPVQQSRAEVKYSCEWVE